MNFLQDSSVAAAAKWLSVPLLRKERYTSEEMAILSYGD